MTDKERLLTEKLRLLEKKRELTVGLPHKFLHPFYQWQIDFINTRKKHSLLVAANQTGKSVANVVKLITWATEKDMWPRLWPKKTPNLFWYLYPSQDIINTEFETKWRLYLPKGDFKSDDKYGWDVIKSGSDIVGISFKSGIRVEFKSYGQKLMNVQAVTLYAVFTDEELPFEFYPELKSRLNATDGYFSMVFTATLGQEEWRCATEEKGERETFVEAFKKNVSLYDCCFYPDGSEGHYTETRIRQIINSYPTDAEVQRRVYGRFVVSDGLIYQSFSPKVNIKPQYAIPDTWKTIVAMDMGSGGKRNHKAAIVFLAISPDYKKGAIFKGWKGADNVVTTEKSVIDKYIELKQGINVNIAYYDYAAKDLFRIAQNHGIVLNKAEKGHDIGEGIVNTLFKNNMLDIFDIPELKPLIRELMSVKADTPKHMRDDDYVDCVRYAAVTVNWNFKSIDDTKIIEKPKDDRLMAVDNMRGIGKKTQSQDIENELNEWNDYMEV